MAPSCVCGFRFLPNFWNFVWNLPQNRMRCVTCIGCSWSRPSGAYRISFGGHRSSGFHRCPLSCLSVRSSCNANFFVSCSSTSGPSDSNLKSSSNRSYRRRWYNPLPRRRHSDQMPTSRIARDWIDSDTPPVSEGSMIMVLWKFFSLNIS